MNKVHFIHRRKIVDGKVCNSGGFTVAYKAVDPMHVVYAIAACGPKDNFSRHLGRVKSEGRLNSAKYRVEVPMTVEQFKEYAHLASPFELIHGMIPDEAVA